MRLYSGKIPVIAGEVVRLLTTDKDIEAAEMHEVELDIESVLKEYLRVEREIGERAKDRVEATGGGKEELGRARRTIAEQKGFARGEESVPYLVNQLLNMLLHSKNVDEVYSDDDVLRRKLKSVLLKHMSADDELDKEVRARMKHLQEGTATWDVEYQRMLEQVKRKKGLG